MREFRRLTVNIIIACRTNGLNMCKNVLNRVHKKLSTHKQFFFSLTVMHLHDFVRFLYLPISFSHLCISFRLRGRKKKPLKARCWCVHYTRKMRMFIGAMNTQNVWRKCTLYDTYDVEVAGLRKSAKRFV